MKRLKGTEIFIPYLSTFSVSLSIPFRFPFPISFRSPVLCLSVCAVCLCVATAYAVRSVFSLYSAICMRRRVTCRLYALRLSTAKFERSTFKGYKKSGVRFTATALCCVVVVAQ